LPRETFVKVNLLLVK